MHEIELIDEPLALEEIEGAVDGDAVDLGVKFLGATKDSGGVKVLLGSFDDAEDNLALAGHAKAAGHELSLETSGLLGLGKRHRSVSLELQLDCNYELVVYAEQWRGVTQMVCSIQKTDMKKALTAGAPGNTEETLKPRGTRRKIIDRKGR
jgi:hypothetical protein